jgi:TatA/E family protein of Tat protein translocase
MFGSIGMPELILIFIVALLVFGPKKLPEIGKSIGKGLAEFKKASDDLKKTIEQEMDQVKSEATAVKDAVAHSATGPVPVEAPPPASPSEGAAAEPDSRPIHPA